MGVGIGVGDIVVVVVAGSDWLELGLFLLLVVVVFFLVVVIVGSVVLPMFVFALVKVAVEDISSVSEVGVTAGENIGASSYEVLGEGELLAVENEDGSVVVSGFLGSSAISLESGDSAFLIGDLFVVVRDQAVVVVDSLIVLRDVAVVLGDAAVEVIDVVVEFDKVFSEGLKGYHKLGFLLESPLVLLLIPDLFPFIEVVDLMPEVAGWNISVVGVLWVLVVVVVMVVTFIDWVFIVVGVGAMFVLVLIDVVVIPGCIV